MKRLKMTPELRKRAADILKAKRCIIRERKLKSKCAFLKSPELLHSRRLVSSRCKRENHQKSLNADLESVHVIQNTKRISTSNDRFRQNKLSINSCIYIKEKLFDQSNQCDYNDQNSQVQSSENINRSKFRSCLMEKKERTFMECLEQLVENNAHFQTQKFKQQNHEVNYEEEQYNDFLTKPILTEKCRIICSKPETQRNLNILSNQNNERIEPICIKDLIDSLDNRPLVLFNSNHIDKKDRFELTNIFKNEKIK